MGTYHHGLCWNPKEEFFDLAIFPFSLILGQTQYRLQSKKKSLQKKSTLMLLSKSV
eukprot:TRINITY_DN7463_c0_g1_i1.p1 TRINITY_DN7463_c0_g1~~TRINITY_DN7463_c0_g1_i1.p1  ORF type:complete len:56 (+),score=4.37 TRINITY_DN7463_c0_g1_i1:53-220(+)